MFDISFGKLVLIMVIALVVLGPERLPKAMKSVANWIKTFRRLSANIQLEISKELKLQELQDSLKKIEQNGLDGLSPELKASIDELKQAAQSIQNDFSNVETNMKLNEELPNLNDAITNLNKNLEKNFHLRKERNDNLGKDNNA